VCATFLVAPPVWSSALLHSNLGGYESTVIPSGQAARRFEFAGLADAMFKMVPQLEARHRGGLAVGVEQGRAQRWHDTDHGHDRGAPLRSSRFRKAVVEREPGRVSSCWCCCEQCNPDWGHPRPNPFWSVAQLETR
jgi:hypothetical protein